MMWANVCEKCQSYELRPSRLRNVFEWLVFFAVVPYRCRLCDRRQKKFRGVMTGYRGPEDDSEGQETGE